MYFFFSQKKQTQAKVSYSIIVAKNITHTCALKSACFRTLKNLECEIISVKKIFHACISIISIFMTFHWSFIWNNLNMIQHFSGGSTWNASHSIQNCGWNSRKVRRRAQNWTQETATWSKYWYFFPVKSISRKFSWKFNSRKKLIFVTFFCASFLVF